MDSPQQSNETVQPMLCAGGCGFYGSSDTQNYCSLCWKGRQSAALVAATAPAAPAALAEAKAEAQPAEAPSLPSPQPAPAPPAEPEAAAAAAAEASPPADDKPVQENRSRCFCCRKKVGLLGFECRCGYVFCSGHRHAQDHQCAFDYASFDKTNLAKANQKVVAAKVDKL